MTPYRSTVSGGDGFGALLRAEWTKLRSVRSWVLTLAVAVALTVGVALLLAIGTKSEGGRGAAPAGFQDEGRFAAQPLAGDGSLVARVAAQANSDEWAKAGLMIRESARRGSRYAAIMVTPGHGVRLQWNFSGDKAGDPGGAPRWLKLTRSGTTVIGYESADGRDWHRVGSVELDGLPSAAPAGLFVASPERVDVDRELAGEVVDAVSTEGEATFDRVRVESGAGTVVPDGVPVSLSGSGDVGPYEHGDDFVETTLSGALIGLMAIVALAAAFIASEYDRGTIRITLAASPRRGRVLAAKAIVIGAVTLAAGLVASFASILLAGPLLPTPPSLLDGPVLRATAGTAALLPVVAVLSLAVATIVRRGGAAITIVLLALLVPPIVAGGLPLSVALWLGRVTPAAGFAIQETVRRYDTAIAPLAGFAVLCGYTAVALGIASWRLRGRDA